MLKRAFIILLITLFTEGEFSNVYAAASSLDQELRVREIEKAVFMASGSQERILKIGMVDCLLYSLKNNSEILVKKIEPQIKEGDVRIARADFEPTLTGEYTIEDNTELSGNTLQGATVFNSLDMNFNAGVSGKFVTGTEYNIEFLNERYNSDSAYQVFRPYYIANPKVTITQPLFRDFGILVNQADIIIAQNNRKQSEKSFKNTAITEISRAKTAYYNYFFSLQKYAIDKLALGRTLSLLEINKERYGKGLISSVDLLETEAAAASREKAVVASEAAIKKAEDALKIVTNLVDDPEVWNAKIELLDKPEFKQEKIELLQCLKSAFDFRPDYQSAKIDLKSKDIKIKVAKNALLPTVDLTGSYGLNGLEKSYDRALQNDNTNYIDWMAGVKVSVPWGGGERAEYDQRKMEKAQALLSFQRLEQDIILEVRDKVREVYVQERQIAVAKLAKEKETQNYEAQQERYAAGQVSTHDILDYQDKLSTAELDYAKAIIDYNISLVNLDKSQGLTLAKNNIKLEE
ncbi:MAG: TolC family protein [Candidatus Omnitrophica bacterium]|jgi:outer membrane protein TolC|nr:TolC family protein [Candidatus Omnitrophota bacterium]